MMRLVFYRGRGDMVNKIIRMITNGPYSHVELQFSSGRRFFASGHGEYQGVHMLRDQKIYGPLWDSIEIPATPGQEYAAQRFAFRLIGLPFDWAGMIRFLFSWPSRRKAQYCSAIILDVLQKSLHMFPGVELDISPNGLYRLFLAHEHTLTSAPVPDDADTTIVPLLEATTTVSRTP